MESVATRCPGKLNLFLEVVAKRPDGYHDIETVVVPAPVADELVVERRGDGRVVLELDGTVPDLDTLPRDGTNLAVRAAVELLHETGSREGFTLRLTKHIPSGAGLGGGSSDAAGVLRCVNRLLGEVLPPSRLRERGAAIGSDVPFFLQENPRAALLTGRGERTTPLECAAGLGALVLFPGASVSTADVYGRCTVPAEEDRASSLGLRLSLARGDVADVLRRGFNRLEAPSRALCPAVGEALAAVEALGLGRAQVTGSGSAVFVLLGPGVDATAAAETLRRGAAVGARIFTGPLRQA